MENSAYAVSKDGNIRYQDTVKVKQVLKPDEHFDRISLMFNPEIMARKTAVIIGTGAGGRLLAENLVRCGVTNLHAIDPDIVSKTNIATQAVYTKEIGKKKVKALKKAIKRINPKANVKTLSIPLDNNFTDEDFEALIGLDLLERPTDVLICACTDSFPAQARAAALAVKYGTLFLASQEYAGGEGGEIYFSYPGVTNSSCPRCALSSRYEAYKAGYRNEVTSDGAPFFAAARIASTAAQIAMMLLMYHEGSGCRYSTMLDKAADRNLVQIRLSPYAGKNLGIKTFDRVMTSDYFFFDETLWIPQVPNNEANGYDPCPLCGGTGDLLAIKGKIKDTREVCLL